MDWAGLVASGPRVCRCCQLPRCVCGVARSVVLRLALVVRGLPSASLLVEDVLPHVPLFVVELDVCCFNVSLRIEKAADPNPYGSSFDSPALRSPDGSIAESPNQVANLRLGVYRPARAA